MDPSTTFEKWADDQGVARESYSLGADLHEAYCLINNPPVAWVLYYSDDGRRCEERTYASEETALSALREILLSDPTTRVAYRAGPAWQGTPRPFSYPSLSGFEFLYLEDSWVLGVIAKPQVLQMTVDVVLLEGHPDYAPARPGEQYCYRRGTITFSPVTSLQWSGQLPPAPDVSGEPDYGSLDEFNRVDDEYVLEGNFGRLRVVSSPPVARLDASTPPLKGGSAIGQSRDL